MMTRGSSHSSNATKALRHIMLHHPSWEVPSTTAQHPDEAAENLLVSVKELMEDKNIVKKNSESAAELKRGALRAVPVLNGVLNLDPGGAPRHAAFVNDFKTERWGDEIKQLAL
ncbi:hypothetical protein BDV93DRAFT_556833 [Ceratobasidium sp. AG-I]|nr:hypothetical protein BDV93DRAFT_556833 [Ceratobasidium sp. AG-I]